MDLYTSDIGAIANGNMRHQRQDALNQSIQEHNNDLASQITDQYKQAGGTAKTSDLIQSGFNMVNSAVNQSRLKGAYEGFQKVANGDMPSGVSSLEGIKDAVSQANAYTKRLGLQGSQAKARQQFKDYSEAQQSTEPSPPAEAEQPAGQSLEEGLEEAGEEGGKVAKGVKALGKAGGIFAGGFQAYEDIKSGHLAGANGWEKAGNLFQIGGGIADTIGMFSGPVGAVADIVGVGSDIIGGALEGIGELVEGKGEKQKAQQEAQEQIQKTAQTLTPIQATQQAGATARAVA